MEIMQHKDASKLKKLKGLYDHFLTLYSIYSSCSLDIYGL